MSDENPFAEPEDADRTVIRPNPGGRRTLSAPGRPQETPPGTPTGASTGTSSGTSSAAAPIAHAPPSADTPSEAAALVQGMTGLNTLAAAASPLFSLVGRIRNRAQHLDPDGLRGSVVSEVRAFETRALKAGADAQDIKIARYAICALLDDVVLNTPWGGSSVWAQQSMVGTFHRETVGGDRFYDLLARLEKEPGKNIDLLECLYLCLSLGFEGRLRVEPGGSDTHLQIREGLSRIIRAQRGAVEADLSPHWKGVEAPHKLLSIWRPVWITASAVALALTIAFVSLSWLLNRSTERVLGQLSVLGSGEIATLSRPEPAPDPEPEAETAPEPIVIVLPPPAPPPTVELERVKGFLEEEIAEGIVEVFQDQTTLTIRLTGSGMFRSGSDQLMPAFDAPLARVSAALNDTTGAVIVVGHSDNVPIRSSRFPSNLHLSLARAETVMRIVASRLQTPERLRAEGQADAQPLASNATPEGRARNRRIELILVKDSTP